MNYLISHLPKGEKVYAKTRKSAWIFIRDVLIAVVLVGIAIAIQMLQNVDMNIMIWVYVGIAIAVLACVSNTMVRFASVLLVVTTHKFMYKEDIITIKIFDTQLQNIDSVDVEYKTPLRRALNVGTLTIRTRSTVQIFKNIAHPDKFASALNKRASDVHDQAIHSKVHVTLGVAPSKKAYVDPNITEGVAKNVV